MNPAGQNRHHNPPEKSSGFFHGASMTDSERIAELENKVSMLRDALIGMANLTPCNQSTNQHHYRMPSGLCVCQDKSWAR